MNCESPPVTSKNGSMSVTKQKTVWLILPPTKGNSIAHQSTTRSASADDPKDKDYQPPKWPHMRSESPIPTFEIGEDGFEIVDSSNDALMSGVSSLVLIISERSDSQFYM